MADESITWRPGGARVVAYAVAVAMVVLTISIAVSLPDDIVFRPSEKITLVLILAATLFGLHGVGRSKVTADSTGVRVVNGYRTRVVDWSDIEGFSMKAGAPWPTMVTTSDDRIILFGIQGTDGQFAADAVDELVRRLQDSR